MEKQRAQHSKKQGTPSPKRRQEINPYSVGTLQFLVFSKSPRKKPSRVIYQWSLLGPTIGTCLSRRHFWNVSFSFDMFSVFFKGTLCHDQSPKTNFWRDTQNQNYQSPNSILSQLVWWIPKIKTILLCHDQFPKWWALEKVPKTSSTWKPGTLKRVFRI